MLEANKFFYSATYCCYRLCRCRCVLLVAAKLNYKVDKYKLTNDQRHHHYSSKRNTINYVSKRMIYDERKTTRMYYYFN